MVAEVINMLNSNTVEGEVETSMILALGYSR